LYRDGIAVPAVIGCLLSLVWEVLR